MQATDYPNSFRIDRSYAVLDASADDHPVLAEHIGEVFWDIVPGAEEVWRGLYDAAWKEGEASGVGFHQGRLWRVQVLREDVWTLKVSYEETAILDTTTTRTLYDSLGVVLSALSHVAA